VIAGFTGTKNGMTCRQKTAFGKIAIHLRDGSEFHHGDCVGADEEAHDIVAVVRESYVINIICHPPINPKARALTDCNKYRKKKPYLDRNRDIVDESDVLIAAPKSLCEELRSGTWATIRYARRQGKPVIILDP
jgi:hypothetical protein